MVLLLLHKNDDCGSVSVSLHPCRTNVWYYLAPSLHYLDRCVMKSSLPEVVGIEKQQRQQSRPAAAAAGNMPGGFLPSSFVTIGLDLRIRNDNTPASKQ